MGVVWTVIKVNITSFLRFNSCGPVYSLPKVLPGNTLYRWVWPGLLPLRCTDYHMSGDPVHYCRGCWPGTLNRAPSLPPLLLSPLPTPPLLYPPTPTLPDPLLHYTPYPPTPTLPHPHHHYTPLLTHPYSTPPPTTILQYSGNGVG